MRSWFTVLGAMVVLAGCGNSEADAAAQVAAAQAQAAQAQAAAQAAAASAQVQAAQAQAQAAAAAAQAQVAAAGAAGAVAPTGAAAPAGASNFGTVTLAPGFMPDPHVARGQSGGGIQASTMNASCAGWVSATPDHLFVAQGAFADLRIMAASNTATDDITLVVQKPDGTYVCNDDTDGTNPVVNGAMPAGTYKIWLGSYQQGTVAAYRLGFSEMSSVTPTSLPQ